MPHYVLTAEGRERVVLEAPEGVDIKTYEDCGEVGYRLSELLTTMMPGISTYSIDTTPVIPAAGDRLLLFRDYCHQ